MVRCVMFSVSALLAVMALMVSAEQGSLQSQIRVSLESLLASRAKGIENCQNKCDKAFNRFAYQIATSGNQDTYEFRACVVGCDKCQNELDNNSTASPSCFDYCKNYNYQANGIFKGVIEPDKACLGGCIINTCQVICEGGTTDPKQTAQNRHLFWPNGGCSIKTAPYSQYLEYVPFNSPNTGQGGSQAISQCCSNALSLCQYVGPTTTTNYQQLFAKTAQFCQPFTATETAADICKFFSQPRNCGNI